MFLHADKTPAARRAWDPKSSAVGDHDSLYFVPGRVRDPGLLPGWVGGSGCLHFWYVGMQIFTQFPIARDLYRCYCSVRAKIAKSGVGNQLILAHLLLNFITCVKSRWFINCGLEGWGVDFVLQEKYVHLEMREWPDIRASSGFTLFRYLKCFFPGGK